MSNPEEIPKRIFQTWKEKNVHNPILKSWQNSWKKYNPDYFYELWDDEDNREFIKAHYPDFLKIFDRYDKPIKRADAIRYFYLYHYGGIYADLDFECLKNFDQLLLIQSKTDVIFGTLGQMDTEKYKLHTIPNAIMISKKGSEFFKVVIDALISIGNDNNLAPEIATGPVLLFVCYVYYKTQNKNLNLLISLYGKDIFENISPSFSSKIFIVEPKILYPINWDNCTDKEYYKRLNTEKPEEIFKESYAITYWMHSW